MIDIGNANRTAPPLSRGMLSDAMNRVRPAYSRDTVRNVNLGKRAGLPEARARHGAPGSAASRDAQPQTRPAPAVRPAAPAQTASAPRPLRMPELLRPVLRGQKTALGIPQGTRCRLKAAFGWNVRDARCDIDASAFLVTASGRVPADDWFVFYGQPESPDRSVRFSEDGRTEREIISIDLGRLDPSIERIVFVMTIDEALERRLNFSMIQEAWLRLLDDDGRELMSYRPEDFYANITSMTLGELYLHRGEWKFNPVGNGVNTDLAGQCAVYGVEITDQEA